MWIRDHNESTIGYANNLFHQSQVVLIEGEGVELEVLIFKSMSDIHPEHI